MICSDHFVGNKRSKDPRSPSYIPTIFPKIYNKQSSNYNQKTDRYNCIINRSQILSSQLKNDSTNNTLDNDNYDDQNNDINLDQNCSLQTKCDAATQVTFDVINNYNFVFECFQNKNDVNTQISVSAEFNIIFNKPCLGNKISGPDSDNSTSCLPYESFHGFKSIENEKELISLTGTTFSAFNLLLYFLKDQKNINSVKKKDRLLLFLMKIKLGIDDSAISVLFKINLTIVSRIFIECLSLLCEKTKDFIFWPDQYSISQYLPKAFKINYPKCRCIIDCIEVKVEQPSSVQQRINLYSSYKSNYTIKCLVAITPSGKISFVSKCYGGRLSDSFIINDSRFLEKLEPGDQVLADKGFPGIKTNVENNNCILVVPPVLHNGSFTEEEVLETYTVASVCILIERVFAQLKTYGILNKLKINLHPYVDNIVHICCVLTNLQSPTIKK